MQRSGETKLVERCWPAVLLCLLRLGLLTQLLVRIMLLSAEYRHYKMSELAITTIHLL